MKSDLCIISSKGQHGSMARLQTHILASTFARPLMRTILARAIFQQTCLHRAAVGLCVATNSASCAGRHALRAMRPHCLCPCEPCTTTPEHRCRRPAAVRRRQWQSLSSRVRTVVGSTTSFKCVTLRICCSIYICSVQNVCLAVAVAMLPCPARSLTVRETECKMYARTLRGPAQQRNCHQFRADRVPAI